MPLQSDINPQPVKLVPGLLLSDKYVGLPLGGKVDTDKTITTGYFAWENPEKSGFFSDKPYQNGQKPDAFVPRTIDGFNRLIDQAAGNKRRVRDHFDGIIKGVAAIAVLKEQEVLKGSVFTADLTDVGTDGSASPSDWMALENSPALAADPAVPYKVVPATSWQAPLPTAPKVPAYKLTY